MFASIDLPQPIYLNSSFETKKDTFFNFSIKLNPIIFHSKSMNNMTKNSQDSKIS